MGMQNLLKNILPDGFFENPAEEGGFEYESVKLQKEAIFERDAVAYISHNMNNAITVIMMWSEMCGEDNPAFKEEIMRLNTCMDSFCKIRNKILVDYQKKEFVNLNDYILNMQILVRAMDGRLEKLRGSGLDNETLENLIKGVSKITNSVSMLSSISELNQVQGNHIMHFGDVQLNDLITNTIELYTVPTSIEVHVNQGESILTVNGDSDFLQNMIENLINNSVKILKKHNTGSQKKIDVDIFKKDGNAVVEFKDNGCGLGNDEVDSIFEIGDTAKKCPVIKSHGVGLHACVKVCKAHGGSIKAANRKDSNGAIFTIKLPLKADKPDIES
jgi:signal transduction histidine kinase